MLMTKQKHQAELEALQVVLRKKDSRIAELENCAAKAEQTAHELVEKTRYALEASAIVLCDKNQVSGDALASLAYSLPYVLSGRRHWSDPSDLVSAKSARISAEEIAQTHGFALPSNPVEAVKSILDLSSMLLVPTFSVPVEGLRLQYPLKQTVV